MNTEPPDDELDDDAPAKPPPEEQLPEEGEPLEPGELDELEQVGAAEVAFLADDEADADPTVNNAEQPEAPHTDLPAGATAADYAAEHADGEEETPPASRGQARG